MKHLTWWSMRSMGNWYQGHPFPLTVPDIYVAKNCWGIWCFISLRNVPPLPFFCCTVFPDVALKAWHETCIWCRNALLIMSRSQESMHVKQPLWDKAVKQQWTIVQCYLFPPDVHSHSVSLAPQKAAWHVFPVCAVLCRVLWCLVTVTPSKQRCVNEDPLLSYEQRAYIVKSIFASSASTQRQYSETD